MKKVTVKGKVSKFYGKAITPALPFVAEYAAYETRSEVEANQDLPKDEEIVDMRNGERKSKAVQAARAAVVEAAGIVKPDLKNSPQLRLRAMAKVFVANGSTEAEARALASATLNIAWEEVVEVEEVEDEDEAVTEEVAETPAS